mmetsp:Transcript_5701/g.21538  ORF Transcript_5701/g.21538 Transcript_5701/m.21538 type:complete len:80 (-) Transcript_5701:1172-1411(-)
MKTRLQSMELLYASMPHLPFNAPGDNDLHESQSIITKMRMFPPAYYSAPGDSTVQGMREDNWRNDEKKYNLCKIEFDKY